MLTRIDRRARGEGNCVEMLLEGLCVDVIGFLVMYVCMGLRAEGGGKGDVYV